MGILRLLDSTRVRECCGYYFSLTGGERERERDRDREIEERKEKKERERERGVIRERKGSKVIFPSLSLCLLQKKGPPFRLTLLLSSIQLQSSHQSGS